MFLGAVTAPLSDASGTAAGSKTLPVTQACPIGTMLIVNVAANGLNGPPSQDGVFSGADSKSNTWHVADHQFKGGTIQESILYVKLTTALTTSDTITISHATANVILWVGVVDAFDDLSAFDAALGTTGASNAPASGPVTGAQSNELVYVGTAWGSTATATPPAGWTSSGPVSAAGTSQKNLESHWQYVTTGGNRSGTLPLSASTSWCQTTAVFKSGAPPQILVPVTDESVTSWTTTPVGTTPLYTLVDEGAVVDITDYVTSQNTPSGQVLEFLLGLLGGGTARQPTDLTGHIMHVVARLNGSAGSVVLKLKQGASTVLATSSSLTLTPGVIQDYPFTLTSTQAGNITDITAIRWHLEGTATP